MPADRALRSTEILRPGTPKGTIDRQIFFLTPAVKQADRKDHHCHSRKPHAIGSIKNIPQADLRRQKLLQAITASFTSSTQHSAKHRNQVKKGQQAAKKPDKTASKESVSIPPGTMPIPFSIRTVHRSEEQPPRPPQNKSWSAPYKAHPESTGHICRCGSTGHIRSASAGGMAKRLTNIICMVV